ncbi:hypothetical protein BGZ73_004772 [Actinomortierella ambigua]|nr:hypothetical protein BGZ73_004772 [Actinomortierella ambigua]
MKQIQPTMLAWSPALDDTEDKHPAAAATAIGTGSGGGVRNSSATVGVPTAIARSFLLQGLQFWYRVPIKLFRPMRVDYLVMARAATTGIIPPIHMVPGSSNPGAHTSSPSGTHHPHPHPHHHQNHGHLASTRTAVALSRRSQFFRATSIGMLVHTVRSQGWMFVYRQVLPPLMMNSFIGSVLYTTYIFSLPAFHPAFTYQKSRTFPPPPFHAVFAAGALAGAAQALVAAPMDSLKVKFQVEDLVHGGKHRSMASFAWSTLKELGWRSVYRGFGLILVKDALACGMFFGVFEWIKQQGYYYFIDDVYGIREEWAKLRKAAMEERRRAKSGEVAAGGDSSLVVATAMAGEEEVEESTAPRISASLPECTNQALSSTSSMSQNDLFAPSVEEFRKNFLFESTVFVLIAGAAAAVAYQAVDYPMENIRSQFYLKEAEMQERVLQQQQQLAANSTKHSATYSTLSSNAASTNAASSSEIYRQTYQECQRRARAAGGWRRFLFKGFGMTAIRSVPAASVGFLVFEIMKRKLDARMFEHEDREMVLYLQQMMAERERQEREEELQGGSSLDFSKIFAS